MNDDGILRSPKWIRSHDPETLMKWSKLPVKFMKSVDHWSVDDQCAEWLDTNDGDPLFIWGTDTKGAYTAAVVLREAAEAGRSVRYISAEDYITTYKEEWDETSGEDNQRWRTLKYIERAFDVLWVDKLPHKPTEFEAKTLGSLLTGRMERCQSTIVVTTLSPLQMSLYGGRLPAYVDEGLVIPTGDL